MVLRHDVRDFFFKGFFSKQRRIDPAGLELHSNPDKYNSPFEVSTSPICPYCNESLGKRKEPTRRSKLSCKKCGNVVCIDPWHQIFPSVYLNVRQGLMAKYLGKLDKCPATSGSTRDFWWAAQQKEWTSNKSNLSDSEAADTLWMLMNYIVLLDGFVQDEPTKSVADCSHEVPLVTTACTGKHGHSAGRNESE